MHTFEVIHISVLIGTHILNCGWEVSTTSIYSLQETQIPTDILQTTVLNVTGCSLTSEESQC